MTTSYSDAIGGWATGVAGTKVVDRTTVISSLISNASAADSTPKEGLDNLRPNSSFPACVAKCQLAALYKSLPIIGYRVCTLRGMMPLAQRGTLE